MSSSTGRSRKSRQQVNVTATLNALADDFNTFYGDLDDETTIRKQAEEARVVRIEGELEKIERVIQQETKRRIEAGKSMQAMFEAKLQAMQAKFKKELREAFEPLQTQIDALVARVEALEVDVEKSRHEREEEIQRANKEVLERFAAHRKLFEVEKVRPRAP